MKQFRVLFIGLVCSLLCVVSIGQTQEDEQALESYLQNNVSAEVMPGKALYDVFGDHEDLLLNLGNAYYRSADLGNARWCYERVLFFNPKSDLAINNINVIREELLEIEAEPFPIHVFKQNLFFCCPVILGQYSQLCLGF